jgi:hypothetical protein
VTRADQALEERVHSLLISAPKTTHLVTPA